MSFVGTMEFVPQKINLFLSQGYVTVDIHLTQTGKQCWVRFTQPHPRLGFNTHTSYSFEEFLALDGIEKLKIPEKKILNSPQHQTSLGEGKMASGLPVPPIGVAADYKKYQSWTRTSGVVNAMPMNSLHVHDLTLSDFGLGCRLSTVAQQKPSTYYVSRIASNSFLRVDGASDLDEWWAKSTHTQKWELLSLKAKRGESEAKSMFNTHGIPVHRLSSFRNPFLETHVKMGPSKRESQGFNSGIPLTWDSEDEQEIGTGEEEF